MAPDLEKVDSAILQANGPKQRAEDVDPSIENRSAPTSSKTMKAVRFHGKEDLRYEDIPEPTCGKGQVKVAPAWCGICGSDLV